MFNDLAGLQSAKRKKRFVSGRHKSKGIGSRFHASWIMLVFVIFLLSLTWLKSGYTHAPVTKQIPSKHHKLSSVKKNLEKKQASPKFEFYESLSDMQFETPNVQQAESFADYANKFIYWIQVGSARQQVVADRLIEKLALLGLEGKSDQVMVGNDPWFRVRIGPIFTLQEADTIKEVLAQNHMEGILFKRKKPTENTH